MWSNKELPDPLPQQQRSADTERIVCPNNATQTMQNETWGTHTHITVLQEHIS